jgi:RHS repeat-associated protein
MVFDTSGKLHDDPATTNVVEGVRRHDYLPFGEENVYNAVGGSRTAANGYVADGVRQQFVGYERDNETGLDFAQARYYASGQGRFTSVDPFNPIFEKQGAAFVSWIGQPQRWNKYSYALNNPLKYIDENGEDPLEAIKVGSRRIATLAAKIAQRSGGHINHPLVMAAEVLHQALQIAFPSIVVQTRGLDYPHEITGAKLVATFEGKSFLGVSSQKEPGIDGILYNGPLYAMSNVETVQLQDNGPSNNVVGNLVRDADTHEGKVIKAGKDGVHLFITVSDPNTTSTQVLNRIQADAKAGTGIVNMTTNKYIPKVTILTTDGAIRVQNGRIYTCDSKGKCSAQ